MARSHLAKGSCVVSQGRLHAHRHFGEPQPNQTDRTSTPVLDLPNFRHCLCALGEEGCERILHAPASRVELSVLLSVQLSYSGTHPIDVHGPREHTPWRDCLDNCARDSCQRHCGDTLGSVRAGACTLYLLITTGGQRKSAHGVVWYDCSPFQHIS
jgi:hypothetical protein